MSKVLHRAQEVSTQSGTSGIGRFLILDCGHWLLGGHPPMPAIGSEVQCPACLIPRVSPGEVLEVGDTLAISVVLMKHWLETHGGESPIVLVREIVRQDNGTKMLVVSNVEPETRR